MIILILMRLKSPSPEATAATGWMHPHTSSGIVVGAASIYILYILHVIRSVASYTSSTDFSLSLSPTFSPPYRVLIFLWSRVGVFPGQLLSLSLNLNLKLTPTLTLTLNPRLSLGLALAG